MPIMMNDNTSNAISAGVVIDNPQFKNAVVSSHIIIKITDINNKISFTLKKENDFMTFHGCRKNNLKILALF